MDPAERAQRGDHVLGDLAGVEAVAAFAGDAAKHLGLAGGAEALAGGERRAVCEEEAAGIALQQGRVFAPVAGDARSDRDALLGVADRRGEAGGEAETAPVGGEPGEGVDGAGDGDRGGRARVDPVAGGPQRIGVERGRRAPRAVEAEDAFLAGRLEQHEAVAADAAHRGLREAEQHRRRDRGVDGVAAVLQQPDGDLGRERVRGGGEAVAGIDQRSSRGLEIAHLVLLKAGHRSEASGIRQSLSPRLQKPIRLAMLPQ